MIEYYESPTTKDFLTEIYRPILDDNNLHEEFIKVEQHKDRLCKNQMYFNNIEELSSIIKNPNIYYYDTYFTLGTNNGKSKGMEDTIHRTVLGFDFDKKDYEGLNSYDIMHKFKQQGLFYHALVDSGWGYHVYICIEKTDDINLVLKVQEHIAKLVGADLNANKGSQLLRLPNTYNNKHEDRKKVNIIRLYKDIKRKSIKELAKRYIMESNNISTKNIKYLLDEKNLPNCIEELINNGSIVGDRNSDLQKLVVLLRNMGKSEAEVLAIAREWNSNNETDYKELKQQVEYMYKNLKTTELKCADCEHKNRCYSKIVSNFDNKDPAIKLSENSISKCKNKKSKRKGVSKMNGNMLLIFSVLKNHKLGLFRNEIEQEITYHNEDTNETTVALSDRTLTKTLKELEENKFITVETIDRKKFYRCIPERVKENCTFNISISATYNCIKGDISTQEYELYCYIRYKHSKQQREDLKALKGNLFQINQEELAKDLGISQGRISQMIDKLVNKKYLSIWYRGKKQNSPFYWNCYLLNY